MSALEAKAPLVLEAGSLGERQGLDREERRGAGWGSGSVAGACVAWRSAHQERGMEWGVQVAVPHAEPSSDLAV